jgi:hypothetical protein
VASSTNREREALFVGKLYAFSNVIHDRALKDESWHFRQSCIPDLPGFLKVGVVRGQHASLDIFT